MREKYNNFAKNGFNMDYINKFINKTHKIGDDGGILYQNQKNNSQKINLESSDEDWKYIFLFQQLFEKYQKIRGWLEFPEELKWPTRSVGSFFMKNWKNFIKKCENINGNQQKLLLEIFTLPDQNVSLPGLKEKP